MRKPPDPHPCAHCRSAITIRPRYCSRRCSDAAKYDRYKATGVERIKRDRRNAKYVSRAKPPVDRVCPECAAVFPAPAGSARVYCSPRCRRRAGRRSSAAPVDAFDVEALAAEDDARMDAILADLDAEPQRVDALLADAAAAEAATLDELLAPYRDQA